ncbi:hypothetical protein Bbelb_228880 [Branchiostoma belcheri]|nr:hypothetical protein Bbelb_228880 [Branchiostoma belcheri]
MIYVDELCESRFGRFVLCGRHTHTPCTHILPLDWLTTSQGGAKSESLVLRSKITRRAHVYNTGTSKDDFVLTGSEEGSRVVGGLGIRQKAGPVRKTTRYTPN